MAERLTEQQLSEILAGAERFKSLCVEATHVPAGAEVASSFAVVSERLVAEVRRLRGMIHGLREAFGPWADDGGCWYCCGHPGSIPPRPHIEGCPWVELEQEFAAQREDKGNG